MTISHQLARETLDLTFDHLPAAIVHEAKRRVLDTLACALGGYDSPPSRMLQRLIEALGGPAESTVYVSGLRTSCMNAALVNGAMVRFTEAMDMSIDGTHGTTRLGHPAEIIPSILAVAERQHSTGKDTIAAVVLGYQLLDRISLAAGGSRAIVSHGWKQEIRAAPIVPLVVGKLMGLTEQQLVNAVGISGSYPAGPLGLLDHGSEEGTMARNLRFPMIAHHAILATLMAERGFEGPSRLFEGHDGFNEVVFRGQIDAARLTQRSGDFTIVYAIMKAFPVNGRLQAQTEGLLRVLKEHPELTPERIARVKITVHPRVLAGMGNPATRRYPNNKETADTSAYYAAALAIVDREIRFSLDQFTPERLQDPRLRSVIDKIELVPADEWKHDHATTEVEVTSIDGTTYRCRVEYPKGHVLNPLTKSELEDKFRGAAAHLMSEGQIREVFSVIERVDELDDIGELTRTLVVRTAE